MSENEFGTRKAIIESKRTQGTQNARWFHGISQLYVIHYQSRHQHIVQDAKIDFSEGRLFENCKNGSWSVSKDTNVW